VGTIAISAAAYAQTDRVIELIDQLKDPDNRTRRSAVEALGNLHDTRAIEPLISVLKDQNLADQSDAATALGKIGGPAVNALISALRDQNANSRARQSAAFALGNIEDPRVVEPLIATMTDPDRYLRSEVVRAISKIRDPRSTDALIAALKDSDSFVRGDALGGLYKFKDPRSTDALIAEMLKESNPLNKDAIAGALADIGEPAIPLLIAASKDPSTYANAAIPNGQNDQQRAAYAAASRAMIASVFAKIGEVAVDPLLAALNDANPTRRASIASALAEINDAHRDKALLALLKKRDIPVVAGAHTFFIAEAVDGSEGALIEALNKFGNVYMDEHFLNCENQKLVTAAQRWAREHGYYTVHFQSNRTPVIWGSGR